MLIKKKSDTIHKVPQEVDVDSYPYALSSEIFHTKQLFLYSEKVKPGLSSSAPHYHRTIDEIVYMVKGSLVAIEGESEVLLTDGDSICFEANSKKYHCLENRSDEDAQFLIIRRAISKSDVVFKEH